MAWGVLFFMRWPLAPKPHGSQCSNTVWLIGEEEVAIDRMHFARIILEHVIFVEVLNDYGSRLSTIHQE
jgi:hypothetical protein